MKVLASPQAVELIRERGGRLFVWTTTIRCCGEPMFVETSTDTPTDTSTFRKFESGAFELFVRPLSDQIPEELHIEVRGRRQPRVTALWNGCSFVA